jgi:parallel beta-helix repeat protein
MRLGIRKIIPVAVATAIILGILTPAIVPVVNAQTMTGVTACSGTPITASETIIRPLPSGGCTGIVVGASNIVIACKSNLGWITSASGLHNGISSSGYTDVTIKNCKLKGFDTGISIITDTGDQLIGDQVKGGAVGFSVSSSTGVVLTNDIATATSANSYELAHNTGVFVVSSKATGATAGYGFQIAFDTGDYLIGNTAVSNANGGFLLQSVNSSYLGHNTAKLNTGGDGFFLQDSSYNYLWLNTATANGHDGFELTVVSSGSNHNTLADNVASTNGNDGFEVEGSNNNLLLTNTANRNHYWGISLNSGSAGNSVINNHTGPFDGTPPSTMERQDTSTGSYTVCALANVWALNNPVPPTDTSGNLCPGNGNAVP